MNYNIFRILGDVSHTVSKCILIWAIHSNKSAEGVSLITQVLYILVFGFRYLDLFWTPPTLSLWNFILKLFYISSSAYIVFLMMRVYARTREREKAWRLGAYSLAGSLLAAPVVCVVFEGPAGFRFFEIIYTFTLILESVCILPQLLLLRQTTVPTVIDTFYLVTLGSYRFFYILNWIVRGITDKQLDPIFPVSVVFGVVQTTLYLDFAWVYWSRQRVKLRGGGVVDGEDLSKGWLISKIIGRKSIDEGEGDQDEREQLARQEEGGSRGARGWSPRGISVSADDEVNEAEYAGNGHEFATENGGLADPAAYEDEMEDEEEEPVHAAAEDAVANGVGSHGEEWRDEHE